MPLHNQLTDLPPLQKMQSLQIWSRKVSLKVLYSLASASVSALIPPALSLSHCTLFHNSPCFFPLLWAFSPLLFSLLLFLRIQKKKKIPFSSIPLLFYKPLFKICFINNTNIKAALKDILPCPRLPDWAWSSSSKQVYLSLRIFRITVSTGRAT